MNRTPENIDLAPYIDQAILQTTATLEQINQGCSEAYTHNFPAVCVYPSMVRQAAEWLHGKSPKVCAVIGFPSGCTTSAVKLYEALEAVENGAGEIDVTLNLGWLKEGKTDPIYNEIAQICQETGKPVKVILETPLLTDSEKRLGAEIAMDAGAEFIKTCTGWFGGATVEDVQLLQEITKGQVGIKAAGGIKTAEQAIDLIIAGATRLGTSRGVELLRQRKNM